MKSEPKMAIIVLREEINKLDGLFRCMNEFRQLSFSISKWSVFIFQYSDLTDT